MGGYAEHVLRAKFSRRTALLGLFLSEDFWSKFPDFFSRIFFVFRAVFIEGLSSKFPDFFSHNFCLSYFLSVFPNIGMRSLPNILPSAKFPNFGNVSCFSCFSCFSTKKKEENLEKVAR